MWFKAWLICFVLTSCNTMRKVHLYFLGTSRTNNSVLDSGCFYPTVSQPDLWDTGTPTIGTRTKPGISQDCLCGHKELKGEGGREKKAASSTRWGPIHAQAHGDTHGCTGWGYKWQVVQHLFTLGRVRPSKFGGVSQAGQSWETVDSTRAKTIVWKSKNSVNQISFV